MLAHAADSSQEGGIFRVQARNSRETRGVSIVTTIRGGSNAKAKRELRCQPSYHSWRRGFVEHFG